MTLWYIKKDEEFGTPNRFLHTVTTATQFGNLEILIKFYGGLSVSQDASTLSTKHLNLLNDFQAAPTIE